MHIRDLSIGRKLVLIIGLITLGALVLTGAIHLVFERRAAQIYLAEELDVLARVVAERSTAAITFHDTATATENLAAFQAHDAVETACLYRTDGTRLARYRRPSVTHMRCPAPGSDGAVVRNAHMQLQHAVLLDGKRIGTLVLVASLAPVTAHVEESLRTSLVVALGTALLAGLLALRLQRLISAPIRRLADMAARVSATGNYDLRAESTSRDETGRLVETFNDMLAAIRVRDASLSASEARYRALVEGIAAVIYRTAADAQGTLTYVSPRLGRVLGYTPAEWLQDPDLFSRSIHPLDREHVLGMRAAARAAGKGYSLEYRMLSPVGKELWICDEAEPVAGADGAAASFQGLLYDVTELKGMQQALGYRLELERAVAEISRRFVDAGSEDLDAAINWSLARAGALVDAGRAYLFELSDDGRRMSNTYEWCAPGVSAGKESLQGLAVTDFGFIFERFQRGEAFRVDDLAALPPEREDFRRILEAQSIRSLVNVPVVWDGRVRGFLGFDAVERAMDWPQHDVDLLRIVAEILASAMQRCEAQAAVFALNERLERRVEERTAELLAANQELEAFTYTVSHDLRSPLLVLDGFSHALLEDYGEQLDEQARRYLVYLREGSRELSELIDGLLLLSRSTRGDMERRTLDLSAMAVGCVEDLRKVEPEREVEVTIEPGMRAYGDPRLVKVLVENLVGNAWKYTSRTPEPRIEFGRTDVEGRTMYFVRDNGAGFNMEYSGKLFQPFQRMHRADEFPGTGIGLATVKRIVGRHGGQLWAEAREGRGAIFYFSLGTTPEG